jgi:hypothetical protein
MQAIVELDRRRTTIYRQQAIVKYDEGGGTMTLWPGNITAITLFVEDLSVTKQFYRDLFGLPVHFEDEESAVFEFGNTLINLLSITAAAELIAPETVACN